MAWLAMGRPLRSSAGTWGTAPPAGRPVPWDRRHRFYRLFGGGRKSPRPGPEVAERDRVPQLVHFRDAVLPLRPRWTRQQVRRARLQRDRRPLPLLAALA